METEVLAALARANLAAALAIVVVLGLRASVRRLFGARSAYALWVLAPVAAIAALLPARRVIEIVTTASPVTQAAALPSVQVAALGVPEHELLPFASPAHAAQVDLPQILVAFWCAGAIASLMFLAWRQMRYIRTLGALEQREVGGLRVFRAENAHAIPALVGALRPRVIVPRDFDERFNADERRLILAHEHAHLRGGDAQVNALIAVSTCLCWFNPLVHLAALAVRRDQELACDASVVARAPEAKRAYAEALLKAQSPGIAIPLGCAWPAYGRRALHERITLLSARPTFARRLFGATSVALLCAGGGVAAWAAQPAHRMTVFQETTQSATALAAAPAHSLAAPASTPASIEVTPETTLPQTASFRPIAERQFGAPQIFPNTEVELFGIAARLHVVPENRDDVSLEIAPGSNLPLPTTRMEQGHLVIDGGLGMTANNCRTRFSGVGSADVPGVGVVSAEALPVIVLHVPRQLNLLVRGVVASDISASDGGRVRIDGCGDAHIGDAANALEVGLYGYGNVDVGAVHGGLTAQLFGVGDLSVAHADRDAIANLIGSGDLTLGPVSGPMEARVQGSGELNIGTIGAGARIRLPGSGPVHLGAITGHVSIEASGNSVARIDAVYGDMDVALNGSTNLDVLSGAADNLIVQIDGSDRMHFGGHAGFVQATLSDGAGNVTVAQADRVDRRRAPHARGDLIIQHQS